MSNRFGVIPLPLAGLQLLERKPILDDRGFFERFYCIEEWRPFLDGRQIAQINHTLTKNKGVVRGMHFQHPPHCETKFVSCLRGCVFDVVVDLRSDSETFLQWHGITLSEKHHNTLQIPEGCAHGFQTLSEDCELLYFHTAMYCQEAEDGLNPTDPKLGIDWPLPISDMSSKDKGHKVMETSFAGIKL